MNTTYYPKVDANPNFVEIEKQVLKDWAEANVFEQSVDARAPQNADGSNNEYVFYDGPPFANGLPHHGHLLTGFVKDVFPRYHTMKGHRVERRFGWDCHGLPAEMEAEKGLNISGRKNITEFGIDNFNDYCRTSVMKYAGEWRDYVTRQARWVDFDNDYKTMDTPFMESVIWAFSELNKKGLIYEGFKVMPYSWAAETVLSASEIRLDDATREKEDKAVTVAFKLKDKPDGAPEADNYYVCAWTTTPWTLPSNLALAVSAEMDYSAIVIPESSSVIPAQAGIQQNNCYILGASSVGAYAKDLGILGEEGEIDSGLRRNDVKGETLVGLSYEPLFPYFNNTKNAFKILEADFIEEGSGTGIVHMAPGFGEDDQRVCAENGIDTIVPVDGEGRFTDAVFDLPYLNVIHAQAGISSAPGDGGEKDSRLRGNDKEKGGNDDTIIETSRCRLRAPTPDDESNFIALHTNEKVMDTMNDGVLTEEEAKADFVANLEHFKTHGYGQWVVESKETGEFMGRVGLTYVAQSVEVDVLPTVRCALLPEFWHGGIGRELCRASLQWGFEQKGFDLIAGGAVPHNPRAKVMMESIGMRHVKDVPFKRMVGPYFLITKDEFDAANVPLSLKGLNVIKETKGKCEAEPYSDAQLEKYGLANLRIINWLKASGKLVKQEDYKHNYPHCWRTDEPIIYKAMSSWFVDVPKIRDRMVELNQDINWMPNHIKDGRFGKWIEGAREWSISRSRFWGCPIPVWRSDNPNNNELYVFGSIAELEEFFGQKVDDLHRPFIDNLTKADPKNPDYTISRVEEVFDCWFESGSMPYAQVHYPFENKDWFEAHFPADFIVEYEAQTRGWFYNMYVLSVALFDKIPFKNCICHGTVLDDQGRKLSKKLKNYIDPNVLFEQYGSDPLRWFMMSSAIMNGSELQLDPEGKFIHDAIRLYIKPIWNAYYFFNLYANADGIKASFLSSCGLTTVSQTESRDVGVKHQHEELNVMDRYILAKCAEMVRGVEEAMEAYDTPAATRAITEFIEVLNNWYIRRNKDRFWNDRKDADKQAAYDTLYTVLHITTRAIAPLLPMVSEAIYRGLTGEQSVHLADWPDVSAIADEAELVADMDRVRDACNAILSIRNNENIRIRQPLGLATLYGDGAERLKQFASLIADETNVKEIAFSNELEAIAEHKLTIDFKVAGKRLGKQMKAVGAAAKSGDWKMDGDTMMVGGVALEEGEYVMQLQAKDAAGAQALSSNDALVVLDLTITPELEAEGKARDLVRLIQQARKDADLNVSDRINLILDLPDSSSAAIDQFSDYISEQTLASSIEKGGATNATHKTEQQLDGEPVVIGFSVAA